MKKIVLVVATVAALLGLVYIVDRNMPASGKLTTKAAETPPPAPDVTFKDLEGREQKRNGQTRGIKRQKNNAT